MKLHLLCFWLFNSSILMYLLDSHLAVAQIVPDTTLPVNSIATPKGNTTIIEGGTAAGVNLFHSFERFSVPTGGEAFFNNASNIQNIFSRVTGRSISNIDGLIRANGTANLFLINPNGIIFGPNAKLNIGGSFLASTANSFKFADGVEFSATNPQNTALLSINVPIGLQYGKNAGEIRVQGKGQEFGVPGAGGSFDSSLNSLEVLPGKSLTLVGGNVVIDGGLLQAPGGRVEIGGVSGEGTVKLNSDGSLTFPMDVTRADISLINKAGINVLASGGGSITISARNLDISGYSLLSAGIAGGQGSVDAKAGDIILNITEAMTIASSLIENNANYFEGNSGNINITADSVSFNNGGSLDATAYSKGKGGDININVRESVSFDTFGSYAGNIKITTGSFSLFNGSLLPNSSGSKGDGSSVIIYARDTISLDKGANIFAENIQLITGKLIVGDGVKVSSSASEASSGSLIIKANQSVELRGIAQPSYLFTNTATTQTGGNLIIETGQLTFQGNTEILTNTKGVANAGDLIIRASDFVKVNPGGGILGLTSVNSTGAGGNVTIETGRFEGTLPILRSLGQGKVGKLTIISSEFLPTIIKSQIVPDQTLPINSTIRQEANNINVVEGGTQIGSNLFHSFVEFSVPTTTTAYFNNALDIKNIISRVTGESVSHINGFLQANGTANIFLLNPNGIILGQNARLNIGGSFLVTTANSIKFADGSFFSATNPNPPSPLAINLPIGLQFAANTPQPNASITVQGTGHNITADLNALGLSIIDYPPVGLGVLVNQTLALVGGEVKLEGGILIAPFGRIELGSVTPGNFVTLTPTSIQGSIWQLGYAGVQNFQDISLKAAALLDASGSGGGSIQLQGRRISVNDGSNILNFTEGSNSGGDITVRAAQSVEMMGKSPNNPILNVTSYISTEVLPEATGDAGNITIDTGWLTLKDGAQIATATRGQGKAGNLTVKARHTIEVIGESSEKGLGRFFSFLITGATSYSTGDGGNLAIETGRLIVKDGAAIVTATGGQGKSGNLTITARDAVEVIGTSTIGSAKGSGSGLATTTSSIGDGGNLTIDTRQLIVKDGAQISTDTLGQGKAGNLSIKASVAVDVSGIGIDGSSGKSTSSLSASAVANTEPLAILPGPTTGKGGNLTIETGRLTIKDQATVSVSSAGAGKAGTLQVSANSIELSNQASVNANTTSGGGSIQLFAPTITLRNSSITTNASGGNSGGDISVTSQFLQLRDGSTITTNATGNEITGGNITLNTNILAALKNSDITANSEQSQGGKISINADAIFGSLPRTREDLQFLLNTKDPNSLNPRLLLTSDITAISQQGGPQLQGIITVNTPDIDPSSGLLELSVNLLDPTQLIATGCPAAQGNSFAITGRGGLPPLPNEPLRPNNTVSVDWVGNSQEQINSDTQAQKMISSPTNYQLPTTQNKSEIVEATGWVRDNKGQVVLITSAPNIPNGSWLTPATCPTTVEAQ
ncbi:filamentous hemagglutinin N-terminal domain-containing protein [Floridanema aerugineum]|uniref:Filamentous hemagglutinin N-terminal domain-containing protein n=1 Tax=Floridaenema aerugineum BLCC-F46 TaxID=3153654 RepID=A0ABV4X0P0_9CYAN